VPTGAEREPLVALRGAGKRYRWGGPWVLSGVDVEVEPGSAVEVRGANGSGKSTLLRLLAGASTPSRGARLAAAGLAVGYAPDSLRPPPLTGAAYLRHHRRLRVGRGADPVAAAAQESELAERLDCAALLGEPLPSLSKGSLRKVVLIQSLLGAARLLVLDEPFDGLDAAAQASLRAILDERRVAGVAVTYSDHRPSGARPRTDAVWSVGDGAVRRTRAREREREAVFEARPRW
jgi:ABC-type multidrug transport system ATPase subunit